MDLSYKYDWNPIKADFSDANSMYASGNKMISGVGDIFTKLADRMADREKAKAELALKQAGLDMDREKLGIERAKMGQAWDIAMLTDAREREKLAAAERKAQMEAAREAADAAAFIETWNKHNTEPARLTAEIEKIDNEMAGIGGDFAKNRMLYQRLKEAEEAHKGRLDKLSQYEEDYVPGWGSVRFKNPGDYDITKKQYEEAMMQRQALEATLQDAEYRKREKEAYDKVKAMTDAKERLGIERTFWARPEAIPNAFALSRARRGLSPASREGELPLGIKLPLEAAYDMSGKSKKSSEGSGESSGKDNILARLPKNKTIADLANALKIDWSKYTQDDKETVLEIAKQKEKDGAPAEQAISEALASYRPGKLGVPDILKGWFDSYQGDLNY